MHVSLFFLGTILVLTYKFRWNPLDVTCSLMGTGHLDTNHRMQPETYSLYINIYRIKTVCARFVTNNGVGLQLHAGLKLSTESSLACTDLLHPCIVLK